LQKLRKLRKSHAKVAKITHEDKKARLFYGIAAGGREQECNRKKSYKKGLQVSVNRDTIKPNKTSRISGKGGKKNHADCV